MVNWIVVAVRAVCAASAVAAMVGQASAEDAQDVRGTKHGCLDFSVGAAWATKTSADVESSTAATALTSGLTWTEIMVKGTSATVYVCLAAAASCGADTTNKLSIPASSSISIPLRGLSVTSIAIQGAGPGTTGQLCGYFRSGG